MTTCKQQSNLHLSQLQVSVISHDKVAVMQLSPAELAVSQVIGYYLKCVSLNVLPETGQSHLKVLTTGFT